MPTFEQITTEYADGSSVNGVDYGSKIRVVMRSPEYIAFVGYGINLISRSNRYNTDKIAPDSKKDTVSLERVRKKFIEAFGEGADEWAIKAISTKGRGTILVNGGGEAMLLPRAIRAQINQAHYDSVDPSSEVEIPEQKTCVQCGGKLPLKVENHSLGYSPKPDHPKTLEECQRLTNKRVVRVMGYSGNYPREWWPYVSFYFTWDGESYIKEDFCSDRCAATYGRRALKAYPALEPEVKT